MFSLGLKVTAFAAAGLLAIGVPTYGLYSMREDLDSRIHSLEDSLQIVRAQNATRMQGMASDLSYVTEKMDITGHALNSAQRLSETMQRQHAESTRQLRNQLESSAKAMEQFQQEAASRLDDIQQDATTRIDAVSGQVRDVRGRVDAGREDLLASRREMIDMRDSLDVQIARNASELDALNRRGERDYQEFDVGKTGDMQRVGDVRLQLKKTDAKKQMYDIVVIVNDSKVERKDRTANEPVAFLGGPDGIRYELVVNYVDKDRIRGYLSTPRDREPLPERTTFRLQH